MQFINLLIIRVFKVFTIEYCDQYVRVDKTKKGKQRVWERKKQTPGSRKTGKKEKIREQRIGRVSNFEDRDVGIPETDRIVATL